MKISYRVVSGIVKVLEKMTPTDGVVSKLTGLRLDKPLTEADRVSNEV
jgi:hypothetical protein